MSNISRKTGRAATVILLLACAPVASAVGQEARRPIAALAQAQAQAQVQAPEPPTPLHASAIIDIRRAAVARLEHLLEDAEEMRALETEVAALRAGQFLWKPERSIGGAVELVVSLEQQKAYLYRAEKLIAVSTVSTGKRGHRTPTGSFAILQKNRRHFSNLYNNAPMPNMQRLTWGGIALHAGALPGYPASHGCVRLPMEFSRLLFGVTRMGGWVHIVAGSPASAAGALAFATGGARGGMQPAGTR